MTRYNVPDMSCGHCKAAVEKAIQGIGASAEVDLDSKTVEVSGAASEQAVIEALKAEGYPATPAA